MNIQATTVVILLGSCVASVQMPSVATAQEITTSDTLTLEQVKVAGALRSSYRKTIPQAKTNEKPQANLRGYRTEIEPTLRKACHKCHGSDTAEGEIRVDTLDPDLVQGEDVNLWLAVLSAVSNGEMPPEDGPNLADDDRKKIVAWLSSEIRIASQVRRAGIFIHSENRDDESAYAREIVSHFMTRAWRRSVSDAEVDRKMEFFASIRPTCEDFHQGVIEVLATVLSSPRFLYLVQSDRSAEAADLRLDDFELATRLSMFLWCSTPDDELLGLAAKGRLGERDELVRQTQRMLADPRHQRFSVTRAPYPKCEETVLAQ